MPGGESTAMRKLIDNWDLRQPILDLAAKGAPIFGTCAGMILLADDISDGDAPVLPLLDISVKRNAFGRQLESFEAEVSVPVLGDRPVHAVFIRAPIVERVGPGVDVIARLDDGRVVAVRKGNVIATAFHPELAGETRFHRLVATMAAEFAEPGRGQRPAATSGASKSVTVTPRLPSQRATGRVRSARLTDLAAVGELSRLSHSVPAGGDGRMRTLGLPVSSQISAFTLFRLPLGGAAADRSAVRLRGARPGERHRPRRAREPARRVDGGRARRARQRHGRAIFGCGWSSAC